MQKAVLLFNPLSGRRRQHRVRDVESAAAVLANAGVEVEIAPTRAAPDAAGQAQKAISDGCDTIIACGGDGTIHDLLQDLTGTHVALGIIPLGTANALAHDLRLPMNPVDAAGALLCAAPRRIAVGKIEYCDFGGQACSRYFTVAAGIGVDAHLFYKLNRLIKNRMGMLAYYSKATHLWLTHRMRYFEAEYSSGNHPPVKEPRLSELLAVRIKNFGGLLRELAPGASLARNDLRLALCRTSSRALFLAYVFRGVLRVRSSVHGIVLDYADRITCRNVPGDTPENIYVQADGELLGRLPITISMIPDALTVLVPKGHPTLTAGA
jgi:YegS/Rv2252/BmrU family lipid kinase